MKITNLILSAALVAMLSACGGSGLFANSEYGCSGLPVGVRCMSASDAYAATEEKDYIAPTDRMIPEGGVVAASAPMPMASGGLVPMPDVPRDKVAIRTPSMVMRIVIAPYEDKRGDLHMADVVYSEVRKRRWQIGLPAEEDDQMMTPLDTGDVEQPQVLKKAKPKPAQTAAKAAPPPGAGKPQKSQQQGQ
jgi:conjugal transfer pilus assembly protein TraV